MLRVKAIPGEPTRFWVESNTLQCTGPECQATYNRRTRHRPAPDAAGVYLRIGDPCPKCGGYLDVRFHTVDISNYGLNGECSCEYFQFKLGPDVSRMPLDEQGTGPCRCAHIDAARDFFADVQLRGHEAARLRWAGRQTEEAQP